MHTCNVRPQRHSKSCLAGYSVNKRILQPVFDLRTSVKTENKLQYIAHVDIIRSQRNVQNYLYRTQTCMTVCTCTCNLRTLHQSIYDINHHLKIKTPRHTIHISTTCNTLQNLSTPVHVRVPTVQQDNSV